MNKELTLAERCYHSQRAEDELFNKIHYILGGEDLKNCLNPTFKFLCYDCSTDHYDDSVEVILTDGTPPLTRESADKILELGFGQIYESQGDNCNVWTRKGVSKNGSSARTGSQEDERWALIKLREENLRLKEAIGIHLEGHKLLPIEFEKVGFKYE